MNIFLINDLLKRMNILFKKKKINKKQTAVLIGLLKLIRKSTPKIKSSLSFAYSYSYCFLLLLRRQVLFIC